MQIMTIPEFFVYWWAVMSIYCYAKLVRELSQIYPLGQFMSRSLVALIKLPVLPIMWVIGSVFKNMLEVRLYESEEQED